MGKKNSLFKDRERKNPLRLVFKCSNNRFHHKISARHILTILPAHGAAELAERLLLANTEHL